MADREWSGREASPTAAVLVASVSPASLHDSYGGLALGKRRSAPGPSSPCAADRAYAGERVGAAMAVAVEIVKPEPGQRSFAVQPRRWVIERTFSWAGRCRRLARDHEATPSSALAFFVLACAMALVRRLARALSNRVY